MNLDRSGHPIYVVPESSSRTEGKDAQRMNIQAAKLVADTVRSTLGPKGMDKMLVDSLGNITVTNDGVTILNEVQVEHPTAKMIVEIAKTQESEVGDGTTTAVVLAGELLRKAEELLDSDIHPTVIAKGYRIAAEKARLVLEDMAEDLNGDDDKLLKVALTAMTGKGTDVAKESLAKIVVLALGKVSAGSESLSLSRLRDNIQISKKTGSSVDDTELLHGIVLDKERVHPNMPEKVLNARIALLDCAIEVKSTESDAKISISDSLKFQEFLAMEEDMILKMVNKIVLSKANVVFCQKGIDEIAQHLLAKKGVFACRRVKKSDMERLAKSTGAKIVSSVDDLGVLGKAGVVEEVRVGGDSMTYVRDCPGAQAVTILVRGSSEQVIDEVGRALEDAIGVVASSMISGKVVPGAGACEIEVARQVSKFASGLVGREQLAVLAFASAMEVIPKTLAENAGLDPIDVVASLKSAHDKNRRRDGIDVFSGKTMDAFEMGVIEPLKIKTQAVSSASEVAIMILRIDDIILADRPRSSSGKEMPGLD